MFTAKDVQDMRAKLLESQTEFAARFGVHQSTVGRWENHGVPTKGTARAALAQLKAELERGAS